MAGIYDADIVSNVFVQTPPKEYDFYKKKRKKKLGLLDEKLKWYVWQLVNLNQGSFTFKNYEFQKIHTFYKKNHLFYAT